MLRRIEPVAQGLGDAVLIGSAHPPRTLRIKEFLTRNNHPYAYESYGSLTPREREVMMLVTCGLLNKRVEGELGISEITVKAHRGQVMRKMKADSLPALVRVVTSLGLPRQRSANLIRSCAQYR